MQNWIIFRLPNTSQFYLINDENEGENSIAFYSFDLNEALCFQSKSLNLINKNQIAELSVNALTHPDVATIFPTEEDYKLQIENAKAFVISQHLKKIVISRPKLIEFNEIDVIKSYLNLSEAYPNAMCYLMQKEGKTWMGATPELLGKFTQESQEFECMSLAGTLGLDKNWTSKEIEEQQAVSESIKDILHHYASEVRVSETKDHISGNIKHLRTDFFAKIPEAEVENLIQKLHPTPAVCGVPKEICKNYITKNEGYHRSLYTGYIRMNTSDINACFVNLRCAQFFKNTAQLYVGGGITAQSNAQQEWLETELKSEAIAKNLVKN